MVSEEALDMLPLGFSLLWPIEHVISLVRVVQQIQYMASSQNFVVSSVTTETGFIKYLTVPCTKTVPCTNDNALFRCYNFNMVFKHNDNFTIY